MDAQTGHPNLNNNKLVHIQFGELGFNLGITCIDDGIGVHICGGCPCGVVKGCVVLYHAGSAWGSCT